MGGGFVPEVCSLPGRVDQDPPRHHQLRHGPGHLEDPLPGLTCGLIKSAHAGALTRVHSLGHARLPGILRWRLPRAPPLLQVHER
jgi:hypothetical protein